MIFQDWPSDHLFRGDHLTPQLFRDYKKCQGISLGNPWPRNQWTMYPQHYASQPWTSSIWAARAGVPCESILLRCGLYGDLVGFNGICWDLYIYIIIWCAYPLVILPAVAWNVSTNRCCNGKIIYELWAFHCHAWLPMGKPSICVHVLEAGKASFFDCLCWLAKMAILQFKKEHRNIAHGHRSWLTKMNQAEWCTELFWCACVGQLWCYVGVTPPERHSAAEGG